MGLSTVSTVSEALKIYFMPTVVKQLNEQSGPVFAAMKKKQQSAPGNEFKFVLQYGRHGGIGARGETDDLPNASPRKNKQGSTSVKNLFARIQLTDKLLKTAKNDKVAFSDELTQQMKDITVDSNDMIRRNLCGSSLGKMGAVKTAVTVGKAVVVKDGTIEAFYEGQMVDILTDSSGTVTKSVDGKEIISVDRDNNTIYFKDNVTVTADQIITLAGNYKLELTGLKDIMTKDTSIYGIDRSTHKWFNPIVMDKASSGEMTVFDSIWLAQALRTADNRASSNPSFFVCSDGVEFAYVEEQQAYKRNTEIMTVEGGYKLPTYNGVPISAEKYYEHNVMDLLNMDDFVLAQLADWDWLDADGSVLSRVANKAAWEATMALYCDILCRRPVGQVRIQGIKEV
ncbi:MAG: phage major capsid protein [Aminipila sp.]